MLYRIRTVNDSTKKMKRRVKRRKEKGDIGDSLVQCSDVLELVSTVNTTHKLTSFDFGRELSSSDEIEVLFGLNNNSMQMYRFGRHNASTKKDKEKKEDGAGVENTGSFEKLMSISLAGHRSDVRAVSLFSTDDILLSVGQKDARMWSIRSLVLVWKEVCVAVCCLVINSL